MRTLPIIKLSSVVLCCILLSALTGCGVIENKRVDYQAGAIKMPPLEIPPDLTVPVAGDRYTVSENGDEIVAVYSDYSKAGTTPRAVDIRVLPTVPNVQLQRYGTERWLLIADRAENVWPVVKAFWLEQGFSIVSEKPEAGLLETDWKENRATIPQKGLRAIIGKLFDKLYSSGEKDMYRTRLERGRNNSTEIYIRHRGMEEVLSADKTTSKWQPRPHDAELEATMLQMLMVKMGGGSTAATLESSPTPTPAPAREAPAPEAPALPRLRIEGNNKTILLDESFDSCWNRVGLALEQLGMGVDDKSRGGGQYFINVKNPGKQPAYYGVNILHNSSGCTISVSSQGRSKIEDVQHVVDLLYQQLLMVKPGDGPAIAAPAPSPTVVPTPKIPVAPKLQVEGIIKTILISDPFDTCWTKVGLALEQLGIGVDDQSKMGGQYFINIKNAGKQPSYYVVNIQKHDSGCVVGAKNQGRGKVEDAQRVVESLYQQLLMVKPGDEPAIAAPAPSPTVAPVPKIPVAPKLRVEGITKTILISDLFDTCWAKVGVALEQLDIGVDDQSKMGGQYFINIKNAGKQSSYYVVNIQKRDSGCVVGVMNQGRGKPEDAQRVVESLYQQLIK